MDKYFPKFSFAFQPIVNVTKGTIVSFEALEKKIYANKNMKIIEKASMNFSSFLFSISLLANINVK